MVVREIFDRRVRLATIVMGMSMVFCGLHGSVAKGTVFTDDFEGSTLDPFWSTVEQLGSITFPSTAQVHGGSQSVQFNSVYGQGVMKHIDLYHDFSTPVYGTFSVWVYDTGANYSSSNYLAMYIYGDDGDGPTYSGVVARDYNFGNGANYNLYTPTDIDSGVDRTEDWHKFAMTASADSVAFYVDDTLVHTRSTGLGVGAVYLTMYGPTWRPAWTGYFDDFSAEYTPVSAAVPEPGTFAIWSLMGLCFVGTGWYRRRKAA